MTKNEPQVLVVDDDSIIRQQLTRALKAAGITCDCAADGEEAWDLCKSQHYPVVVTDLRMPKRHGYSLATQLLGLPRKPQIMALTGIGNFRIARELRDRGVVDVVYKPINYFGLANRIKRMLGISDGSSVTDSIEETGSREPADPQQDCSTKREATKAGSTVPSVNCGALNRWIVAALRWLDWKRVPPPPRRLLELAQQTNESESYEYCEHGLDEMCEIAVAVELGDNFQPVGKPYKLILRQLTWTGARLMNVDKPRQSHMAVTWRTKNRKRIVALLNICRCTPLEFGVELECEFTKWRKRMSGKETFTSS